MNDIGAADSIIVVIRLNIACKRKCFAFDSDNCNALAKADFSSVTKICCISVFCQYAPITESSERVSVAIVLGFDSLEVSFSVVESLLGCGKRWSNINARIDPSI